MPPRLYGAPRRKTDASSFSFTSLFAGIRPISLQEDIMKNLTLAAGAALLFTTAAFAGDYRIADLNVIHPMAFETARTAQVAGGYLTIENTGTSDDTLLEVRVTNIPRVELHLSETDANGVARMTRQDGIPVPAGETVTLKPGGLHVMFIGLNGDPFEQGEEVAATLVFEKAGTLEVVFDVEARSASDHGTMNQSGHTMDHSKEKKSD
jgi:copper(I)-binding protein